MRGDRDPPALPLIPPFAMPRRKPRVDELLRREISTLLHTDYQEEAVYVTISEVDVAPDLRQARVYYSLLGDQVDPNTVAEFFRRHAREIRRKVGRAVILKYNPVLTFVHDESLERGFHLIERLDELEQGSA